MEIQIFKDTAGNYYVRAGEYKVRLSDGTRHDGTTIGHFELVKNLPIHDVSKPIPKKLEAGQNLFDALQDVAEFTALESDMQAILSAVEKDNAC